MPLSYAELEKFYEDLVVRARASGVTCGITSGMACVVYGVAQTTRDCDMLCSPGAAQRLLAILSQANLQTILPAYRGHITPPLDERWLSGGWTSHFIWRLEDMEAYLDVFGVAPRASSRWESELQSFYCSPHIVAEMKRTDRDKDWPYATALGVKLLEAGDSRGWLHIFNYEVLTGLAEKLSCPPEMIARRPVLRLLASRDLATSGASRTCRGAVAPQPAARLWLGAPYRRGSPGSSEIPPRRRLAVVAKRAATLYRFS